MTDTIYLFGAGSSVQTKATRRTARFKPRSFRIGNIPFRPKRRVPVTLDWVRANLAEVIRHIESGQLIVQHSHDDFVDPQELARLLGVAPAVVDAIVADTEPVRDEDKVPPADEPPADPEQPETEPVVSEVEAPPTVVAEPAPVEPEPVVAEAAVDALPPVEAEPAVPSAGDLDKMNRTALVALCGTLGLPVEDSDTKKMLVAKIVAR